MDWTNQYSELEEEEVNRLYFQYCRMGFRFVPFVEIPNISFYPPSVRTPRGKYLTKTNIEKILSNPLVIGDQDQVEALETAEFFKIIDARIGFQNSIGHISS